MSNKWIVDISKETPITEAEAKELMSSGCIGFAIRAGKGTMPDSRFAKHVKMMENVGAPFIIYMEIDPDERADAQVKFLHDAIGPHSPVAVALGAYQWWVDDDAYKKVVIQKLPGFVKPLTAHYMHRQYGDAFTEVSNSLRKTGIPLVGMTEKKFIDSQARQVGGFINTFCDYFWNDVPVFFEEDISFSDFTKAVADLKPDENLLPKGVRIWSLWRIGQIPVPGFEFLKATLVKPKAAEVLFGVKEMKVEVGEFKTAKFVKSEAVDATPSAQALAEEFSIDIAEVEGSGRDGKVIKPDVEKFIEELELEEVPEDESE